MVVTQFTIKSVDNNDVLDRWCAAALGAQPTKDESDATDDNFSVQKSRAASKLIASSDYILALYLSQKGSSSVLDRSKAEIDNR